MKDVAVVAYCRAGIDPTEVEDGTIGTRVSSSRLMNKPNLQSRMSVGSSRQSLRLLFEDPREGLRSLPVNNSVR